MDINPCGSRERRQQLAEAMDAIAAAYTKDSVYERACKRLWSVLAAMYRPRD